jgi:hypothetical protein
MTQSPISGGSDPWVLLAEELRYFGGHECLVSAHVLDLAAFLIFHADEFINAIGSARDAYRSELDVIGRNREDRPPPTRPPASEPWRVRPLEPQRPSEETPGYPPSPAAPEDGAPESFEARRSHAASADC